MITSYKMKIKPPGLRRFEKHTYSRRYWEIWLSDNSHILYNRITDKRYYVNIKYGTIEFPGIVLIKEYFNIKWRDKYYHKCINKKLQAGYIEQPPHLYNSNLESEGGFGTKETILENEEDQLVVRLENIEI